MREQLKKNNSGFTLLELIIATMVLAVIMTPLMRSFFIAANTAQSSVIYGGNTDLAENAVEVVKSASATNIEAALGSYFSTADVTKSGDVYQVEFKDGTTTTETIVVTMRDPDPTLDGALLASLNTSDLSTYTDMDLSLIQQAGARLVDGTLGIFDFDAKAYQQLASQGFSDWSTLKRTILVNLNYVDATLRTELNANGWALDASEEYLHYEVKYRYHYGSTASAFIELTAFLGAVPAGADDVVALQLVYMPLNNNSTLCTETIDITYGTKMPDDDVRLFLIKQKRATHGINCTSSTFNPYEEVSASGVLDCAGCASAAVDANYACTVILNDGGGTDGLALHANIHLNAYTGVALTPANFIYTKNGTTTTLSDGLVVETSGGRISIVEVQVYTGTVATGELVTEMNSIKLN
ncbi:MAG: prepilin-type N-terminal cleavage/methylation domain-containing protein [Eubacteriales bacterium]